MKPTLGEGLQPSIGRSHVNASCIISNNIAARIGHGSILGRDLTSNDLGWWLWLVNKSFLSESMVMLTEFS